MHVWGSLPAGACAWPLSAGRRGRVQAGVQERARGRVGERVRSAEHPQHSKRQMDCVLVSAMPPGTCPPAEKQALPSDWVQQRKKITSRNSTGSGLGVGLGLGWMHARLARPSKTPTPSSVRIHPFTPITLTQVPVLLPLHPAGLPPQHLPDSSRKLLAVFGCRLQQPVHTAL